MQRASTMVAGACVSTGAVLLYFAMAAVGSQDRLGRLGISIAVVISFAVIVLPAVARTMRRDGDLFEISNLFIVLYALSALSLPMSYLLRSDVDVAAPDLMVPVLGLFALGAAGFWLGYHLPASTALGKKFSVPPRVCDPVRIVPVAWTFILIGLAAIVAMIVLVGGWSAYAQANWLEKYRMSHGLGTLSIGLSLAELGVVLLFLRAFTLRSWRFRFAPVVLLVGVLGYVGFLGMRRMVLVPLLALAILYHYHVQPIRLRRIALPGAVLAVFFLTFGHFRGLLSEDFRDLRSYLHEHATWTWIDPAEGYFRAPFANLTTIVDTVPSRMEHGYGRSYAQAPLVLIPSPLFPSRPITASAWFAREFYPEEYYLGGGRGFSSVTEAYWNFGYLGVPVVLFLVGVALRSFYEAVRAGGGSHFASLLYAFCGPFPLLAIVAIDLASAMKVWLINAALVATTLIAFRALPSVSPSEPERASSDP